MVNTPLPPPGVIGGGGLPGQPPPPPPPPSVGWSSGIQIAGGETGFPTERFLTDGNLQTNWNVLNFSTIGEVLFIQQAIYTEYTGAIANGDLATAFAAAGIGHEAVGFSRPWVGGPMAVIFNTTINPRVWTITPINPGFPGTALIYTAATGIPAGDGLDMGYGLERGTVYPALAVLTGPATRYSSDANAFGNPGVPPSQLNRVQYEWGQEGVYIGAANGGVIKTIDFGANWGYVRPHAGLGTLWPAGAIGRDIAFIGQPASTIPPDLYVIGTVDYKRLQLSDNGPVWEDKDGAPPDTDGTQLKYFGAGKMGHLTGAGLFRISTDTGESWTTRGLPGTVESLESYDIAPDATVWVFAWETTPTPDQGLVYKSIDNGANWTLSLAGFDLTQPLFIAANPSNSSQIAITYKSTTNTLRTKVTQNAGSSWVDNLINAGTVQVGRASGKLVWAGTRIICMYDLSDGRIIASYSDDFGATWTDSFDEDQGAAATRVLDLISGGVLGPIFAAIDRTPNPILRSPSGEVWTALSSGT